MKLKRWVTILWGLIEKIHAYSSFEYILMKTCYVILVIKYFYISVLLLLLKNGSEYFLYSL